jgi:hypothetical protein
MNFMPKRPVNSGQRHFNGTRSFMHHAPVVGAPKHCSCGACAFCMDNARWERIFADKFADPTYYAPRLPRLGSTLSSEG